MTDTQSIPLLSEILSVVRSDEESRTFPPLRTVMEHSKRISNKLERAIWLVREHYSYRLNDTSGYRDFIGPLKKIALSDNAAEAIASLELSIRTSPESVVQGLVTDLIFNAVYIKTNWIERAMVPSAQSRKLVDIARKLQACSSLLTTHFDIPGEPKVSDVDEHGEPTDEHYLVHKTLRVKEIPRGVLARINGHPITTWSTFYRKGRPARRCVVQSMSAQTLAKHMIAVSEAMREESSKLKKLQDGKGTFDYGMFAEAANTVFEKHLDEQTRRRCSRKRNAVIAALYNAACGVGANDALTPKQITGLLHARRKRRRPGL